MGLTWHELGQAGDPDVAEYRGDPGDLLHLDDLVAELTRRPDWHAQAACRGKAATMFLERGQDARPAQLLCSSCPVAAQCLAAGMREHYGIWSGTSERVRKRLRRRVA